MIRTLRGLCRALDDLFGDTKALCAECQNSRCYQDCVGYVWLLREEVDDLLDAGVEVVVVNHNVYFLNSFSDGSGGMDVGIMKPPCPYCRSSGCSIRNLRPLACRMYPLGFSRESGMLKIVLHTDCLFSERFGGSEEFRAGVAKLFRRIDPKLLRKIISAYRKVLDVSIFPEGDNKVDSLLNLRGKERR
jgi:Fe-S-cluster containining protein